MCLEQLPFQRCKRAGNVSTQCLGSSSKAATGAHAVEDLKSPIHFFDLPSLNPTLHLLLPSSAGLPLLRNHHLGNQRKPKSQRPLFLPEWFPSVPFLPVAVTICLCETGEQVDADKDALLSSRKYARTLADAKSLGVFCVEMVTCTYETRWGFVEIWCWGLVVFRCSFSCGYLLFPCGQSVNQQDGSGVEVDEAPENISQELPEACRGDLSLR